MKVADFLILCVAKVTACLEATLSVPCENNGNTLSGVIVAVAHT